MLYMSFTKALIVECIIEISWNQFTKQFNLFTLRMITYVRALLIGSRLSFLITNTLKKIILRSYFKHDKELKTTLKSLANIQKLIFRYE